MTEEAYTFLMGRVHPQSNNYEDMFNYCRNFGWCAGFGLNGAPVLTKKGVKAVKAYNSS